MPVSVGRHNLARIRKQLRLTQADVAKLVGCSPATIKAVEIGKLALSEGLASRISRVVGVDTDWLLRNDLNAPTPAVYSAKTEQETLGRASDPQNEVILELFSRLFAFVGKMEKNKARASMELSIVIEMQGLKEGTIAMPNYPELTPAINFLVKHPDSFDPDLRQWVDLKGLQKSILKLSSQWYDALSEDPSSKPKKLPPRRSPSSPAPGGRYKKKPLS